MASVINEHQIWLDSSGNPIVNGSIYIGVQNQDPVLNPITIYSDRDLTVVIANPQITDSFGRATNKIWIAAKYSITVQDSASVQRYSELDVGEAAQTGISNLTNIVGTDTITADGNPTITALTNEEIFTFTAIGTITGAVTLQIDATAAKSILKYHDQPLVAGDIEINQVVSVIYNSTDDVFELQSSTAAANFPTGLTTTTITATDTITSNSSVYLNKGADIASANDTVLLTDGNYNDITGTTTINGLTDGILNETRKFQFDGAVLLKHNTAASAGFGSLFLPAAIDYTTATGDEFEFTFDGALWRCTGYTLASGRSVIDKLVQVVNVQDGEFASDTGLWIHDDTIAQIDEGNEFMTLAITPVHVDNKLRVDVVIAELSTSESATATAYAGLFNPDQEITDALAVTFGSRFAGTAWQSSSFAFTWWGTAGTTSATTFSVRAGAYSSGTTNFNGSAGARKQGGAYASSITITEYKA